MKPAAWSKMDRTQAENERVDELGRKGFRIIQDTKSFRFGMDAVLLADFARIGPEDDVVDLGTGNGILLLLLAARDKGKSYTGLEIQEASAELARRNMALNGLEKAARIVEGDLCRGSEILYPSRFDAVICNPPYTKKGSGLINPNPAKAIARHEILCTLEDVLRESAALLKEGGRLFMIHRKERMDEVMSELEAHHLYPRRLRQVQSFSESPVILFMVEAVKNQPAVLVYEAPCVLYESRDRFSDEVYAMYHGHGRPCKENE